MIAELFLDSYDVYGRKVFRPGATQRRRGFRPTYPMGRNLTEPLKHKCANFGEMRRFLATCRGSHGHRFNKRDYWQPPEEFEETRAGDCVDFAIWAWRQVLDMGYEARFVGGKAGKYGEGHAWVTFEKGGKCYLMEPQLWPLGLRMPRLSTLRYHPKTSVGWDGEKISYYVHEGRNEEPPLRQIPALVAEWVVIWTRFWTRAIPKLIIAMVRRVFRRIARRWSGTVRNEDSKRRATASNSNERG